MKNSLAKKIVLHIVMFSSVVTFLTTAFQLYADYQNQLSLVSRELNDIESSFTIPLNSALWFLDKNQINKQLEGISKLPHIAEVTLASHDLGIISHKNLVSANGAQKTINLNYNNRNLGEVKIITSKDFIFSDIIKKSFFILLSNLIKTFLVALYALYIFNKLITTPLTNLALESAKMTLEQRALFRRKTTQPSNENELDVITKAIQEMQGNFSDSYTKLKSAESRFRDIASLNLASLFETDENLTYTLVHHGNDGYRIKDFISEGNKLFDLPFTKDQKMHLFSHREIVDLELNIADEFYLLTLKPFFEPQREFFLGYRGTVTNITEKVKIEKQLEIKNAQLAQIQKIESVGLMTASISHDLNNLLTIMSTSIQLIKDPTSNEETRKRCMINAEDAINKSGNMLRKLMDFSRIQALTPQVLDIETTLLQFESILKLSLGNQIQLLFDLKAKGSCKLDINQFETMLINLLLNSKDALPKGGTVTITSEDVTIRENNKIPDGEYVKLIVSDDGEGISPTVLHKIFEPFFTTKDLGHGTGLGLTMVMNFVQQSQSYIEVDSKLRIGTSFIFYFPKYSEV